MGMKHTELEYYLNKCTTPSDFALFASKNGADFGTNGDVRTKIEGNAATAARCHVAATHVCAVRAARICQCWGGERLRVLL